MRASPFKKEQDALNARYEAGQRALIHRVGTLSIGSNAAKRRERAAHTALRALQVAEFVMRRAAGEAVGRAPKLKSYGRA